MKIILLAILCLLFLLTGTAPAQQKNPAAYLTDRLPNDSRPDRQIEQANLTEDILTVTQAKDREDTQTGYTTHSIRLKRIE